MPATPLPPNESKRLDALRRYRILDTAPEEAFDDFVLLASTVCQTPIAIVTLVDGDRQWFKARRGLEATETPREQAFCAHTILHSEVMVVEDATADARFAENPLVTGAMGIRFYAGAPLIDGEGNALGSLCVIDRHARALSAEQDAALQALARRVIAQLELRRTAWELADALAEIKTLHGLLPICAHCKRIRNAEGQWEKLEAYVSTHTEARMSHGICPECMKVNFPEAYEVMRAEGKI